MGSDGKLPDERQPRRVPARSSVLQLVNIAFTAVFDSVHEFPFRQVHHQTCRGRGTELKADGEHCQLKLVKVIKHNCISFYFQVKYITEFINVGIKLQEC